jgi:hypothetical protein
MAYLSAITSCTTAVVALLSYITYQRFFHPLATVPGPFLASLTRLWLLHQSRTLQRHRIEIALHEEYGPIVRISPNELCISDLNFVKTIYGANSRFLKADWYETVEPKDEDAMNLLGERDVEKYKHQRRLIGPLFTTQAVKKRENLLDEPILAFVRKMKEEKGKPVDLVKWMNILAIDLLTEITFSKSLDYVGRGEDERNSEDVDDFWKQIHWVGLVPGFWRWYVWVNEWIGKMGISPMFVANIGKLSIIKVSTLPYSSKSLLTLIVLHYANHGQSYRGPKDNTRSPRPSWRYQPVYGYQARIQATMGCYHNDAYYRCWLRYPWDDTKFLYLLD